MARYIADLTELASSTFAAGDFVEIWHAAGGSNRSKKLRLDRFAMLSGGNAFVGNQTVTGNVVSTGYLQSQSSDGGSGEVIGLSVGGNNNGSTPHPGMVVLSRVTGASARLYCDNSGIWRTRMAAVNNSNYATGDVVGAQTSSLDSKDVIGDPDEAGLWRRIAQGAAAVRRFAYKSGAYGGEEFSGVIVDYAPHYGMDRDEAHPAGKSLNEINAIGDLLLAVSQLGARVAALEGAQ